MGKRKIRLQDVAERAGVSVSTVSLVLNDKAVQGNVRISDRTIQKVIRTALSMGYLQRGTVGLIVPWLWPPVEIPLIEGITQVFREAHYNLAMGVTTNRRLEMELEELRAMDNKGFDSVILQPGSELLKDPDLLRQNFKNWKRVVVVNQFPTTDFSYVTVDQEACGYIATKHLIEQGHRHIVCARGDIIDPVLILDARVAGYEKAMVEAGLSPLVAFAKESELDIEPGVTAIYCCRVNGATDLLGRCIDMGVNVPQDLSIIGIADDREKQVARPKMSTVDIRARDMGVLAAEMVMDLIDGKSVKSVVLDPRLIKRDSVRTM
ncbi:MAG: DNA-binding LacI/PurR family transcriptional regulator [Candidatus Latescibacterota bacterium]|jgi:DNA-binding LacI/PurR family transcriptional regulator